MWREAGEGPSDVICVGRPHAFGGNASKNERRENGFSASNCLKEFLRDDIFGEERCKGGVDGSRLAEAG